jgi:hypothetical protein
MSSKRENHLEMVHILFVRDPSHLMKAPNLLLEQFSKVTHAPCPLTSCGQDQKVPFPQSTVKQKHEPREPVTTFGHRFSRPIGSPITHVKHIETKLDVPAADVTGIQTSCSCGMPRCANGGPSSGSTSCVTSAFSYASIALNFSVELFKLLRWQMKSSLQI